jgi:hypothetical protein
MEPAKYQYNNDKTIGGYSLKEFMENNQTVYGGGAPSYISQSSERFKDLVIPVGFVMQPQGGCSSMSTKANKILTIPDQIFDSVFGNISKQSGGRKNNKTRKIRHNQ